MCKLMLLLCLFFSTQSFALYIEESSPSGQEVDLNVDAIRITFSEDITSLVHEKKVRPEHLANLDFGKIPCDATYEGLKTIVCKLKKPLSPDTQYALKVKTGFQALKPEERISYDAPISFKSSPLSITRYKVDWNENIPVISLEFNLRVKPEGRTGIIQCPSHEVAVTFEPLKDQQGENNFRVKGNTEIKADEFCAFYFTRPLSYRDHVGSFVPAQKIVVDHSVTTMEGNGGYFDYRARCAGNYQVETRLFGQTIPYLKCEFNDAVNLDIELDPTKKIKIEDYVKITPKDKVKIEYKYDRIVLSNFETPNKNYIVKVAKNLPLRENKKFSRDIIFQLETIDNPPLISPLKRIGVIEKDGPWLVGYSALNVKSLEVLYDFFDSAAELHEIKGMVATSDKLKEQKTIVLDSKENQNELLPLDVKKWAKENNFKAGLFSGRMKAKEVDYKFQKAEDAIFPDKTDIQQGREFDFGYRFTDIGLHVKQGKKGMLVWATALKTGKPISDASIRVLRTGGGDEKLTTNGSGLAFFSDLEIKKDEEYTVVASKGDDISFINNKGEWNSGIGPWDFNLGGYYWQDQQRLVVDIVAERPLYLPNEKVFLKLFVRKRVPDSLELENAGKQIKVSIMDSRGDEALVKHVELNAYGTATLEYQLPPKAPTGRYAVYIQEQEVTINLEAVFQVEEFRKPEFKVVMDETPTSYEGKITYFKGGPVKNVPGEVAVLFKKKSFNPEDEAFNRFMFPSSMFSYDGDESSYSELKVLSRTEIESNDQGIVSVKKSTIPEVNEYGTLIIEASFKDENGGNIAGRVNSKINPFKYIPGIDLSKWLYNTGEKIEPEVIAIAENGKHVAGVKMKLRLIQVNYIYERRLGSGNYFYYDSRREEKELPGCTFTTTDDFKSCALVVKKAGYYEFIAEVVDKKLKSEPTKTGTYVYEEGEFMAFEASNNDRINVTVDSSKLKLGDKLKLMAISPLLDGEALITFERDGILFSEQVAFKGNVVLYEKTITDEKLIPGFFVSIVIVKGRTSDKIENKIDLGKPAFKIGYKRIEVANFEKRLVTKVIPSKKQLEPGQMMEARIELKDYKGKAVKGELAIAVVDDALLSLAGPYQKNYDILDTFYTLGQLGVLNYQTLTQLIGRRTFGKKGANAGGGGGFEIRSDFKNTAFWEAQGETNDNGEYNIKFKVPDNLTTWKIIVVSVDKSHRFGLGENEFQVSKSLMIEPALPNFLVDGDNFQAKVVVTNRSGKEQKVNVEAKSSKMEIKEDTQNITVKDDDKGSVFFAMKVNRTKSADVMFTAKGDKIGDGFKIDIPVNSSALVHSFADHGVLKDKKDVNLSINPKAFDDTLNLTVKTSSTAIDGLDEVFRYVLTYPYGCWEQRLTSAYVLVQYEAFKDALTYRFEEKQGSISTAVQNLLNLATNYQTSNGGMRYYPGGQESPDVYLSIFTGQAFNMMKQVGYKIDSKVEENLKTYLKSLLTSEQNWNSWYQPSMKTSTRSMILNVLGDMGEKNLSSHVSKLYADRASMDLFGLGQLAGFLYTQPGFEKEANTLFERIDSLKVVVADRISYKEPNVFKDDNFKFWNYTSDRSVCSVLQSLTKYSNNKNALASVVRSILSKMKGGHWYNTQENIYCFEALRQYVNKFEKKGNKSAISVAVDGETVKAKATTVKFTSSVELGASDLKTSSKTLTLTPEKNSELYYTTILRYETPYGKRAKISQGFDLTKTIERYDSATKKWILQTDETIKIKRSDILRIKLKVSVTSDRYQVMLNDRLAGCLEPINTQLSTASLASAALSGGNVKKYRWESPYYHSDIFEYMDLRLDAAQFYSSNISKGTYQVEYLVQAIAVGEFFMPESTIEEMYYPDVRATEVARKIIVNE